MKFGKQCHDCGLKQAMAATMLTKCSKEQLEAVKMSSAQIDKNSDQFKTAPAFHAALFAKVKEITNNADPFLEIKKNDIALALSLYDRLLALINKSENTFEAIIKITIIGNLLDHAVDFGINLDQMLEKEFSSPCLIWDIDEFKIALDKAKTVLYIADNAGETVFDTFLLRELTEKKVFYAVRESAVINDATYSDAVASGIDNYATIIKSGCSAPGLIPAQCSSPFLNLYNNADIIIAKGQGNLETLTEENKDVFFLLKAKCPVIADYLEIELGSIVLKHQEGKKNERN